MWHGVQSERHGSEWPSRYTAAHKLAEGDRRANPFERVADRCADALVKSGSRW